MAEPKTTKATPARSAAQKAARARKEAARAATEEIEVKLAHHLPAGDFTDDDKKPGDTINVTRQQARHLLAAGYLAADPEDPDDVRRILQLDGAGGGAVADAVANAAGS